MKQTFLLSEIGHWGSNLNFTKAKPIAISEFDDGEEWEKIDIAWPVKNWVEYHDLSHTIQLICETCSGFKLPISNHNDHKPFIVIDTFPQRTVSRQARSVNCGPDSSECCRDSLYIDFTTIGWGDWVSILLLLQYFLSLNFSKLTDYSSERIQRLFLPWDM